MKKFFTICCLAVLCAAAYATEKGRIDIPLKQWKAWGNDSIIDLKAQNNELTFSRRKGNDGWNTPMYTFPADKRPAVSANTFLVFEYKASRTKKMEININNATEGTQYVFASEAVGGSWQRISIPLSEAVYKRGKKAGINADGMAGDKLAGFQIAYSGKEITIRNVYLYEADPNEQPKCIDIPLKRWTAWGNDSAIDLKAQNNELTFTRRKGNDGWNTPMYTFPADKRPTITALTFLSFEYKASRARKMDININNATEGSQYAISTDVTAGKWTTAKIHINSAAYKRGGKAGITADGMAGDKLAGFQIAYSGREITIRNVRIYEADPNDPGVQAKENPAVKEYVKNRKPVSYRQLQNGAVFPFGVIHALRQADRVNGEFFSQPSSERTAENLRIMRCAGFNTYSNFCEIRQFKLTERLDMLKEYDMLLLETATTSRGLINLPENHPLLAEVRKAASHPNLLAYYGQDEPTDVDLYLRNKKRIESLAQSNAPVTSAMHMMSVAKEVGPAMDIITIDPYILGVNSVPNKTQDLFASHCTLVRNAMNYSGGKRVWGVGQTFSLRVGGQKSLRFPTVAEIRFEAFNMIASGANGYFAFIWQDQTAYLRADSGKGESFDQTLCDPWGNLSIEGEALGAAGRKIVPVMSFFLDRKAPAKPRSLKIDGGFTVTQWHGEYGNLFIVLNRDLENKVDGKVAIPLEKGEKLYDLCTLSESDGTISLQPGDGGFLLAAAPEKFAVLKKNIAERKARDAAAIKKLTVTEPAEFKAAREEFGRMHRRMMAKVSEFDGNPAKDGVRNEIKALSKEYFDALREYRKTGKVPANVAALPEKISKIK